MDTSGEAGEPEGRRFLKHEVCSICQQPIMRDETKELIRFRGMKFYLDALKDIGRPSTRVKGTWCTPCTRWFLEGVRCRRAEAVGGGERVGSVDVVGGDAADGDKVER